MRTYRIPLHTISLVREKTVQAEQRNVTTSAEAAKVLRAVLGDTDREQFVVLCLNGKHAVIGANIASTGSVSMSIVHPREAFKAAILMNASSVIFGHNHPSGETESSPEDIAITSRLVQAGNILGIQVLDHIVLGDGTERYYSFADEGKLTA